MKNNYGRVRGRGFGYPQKNIKASTALKPTATEKKCQPINRFKRWDK